MVILLYSAALALALSTHLLSRCLSPPIYLSIYLYILPILTTFLHLIFCCNDCLLPPPLVFTICVFRTANQCIDIFYSSVLFLCLLGDDRA